MQDQTKNFFFLLISIFQQMNKQHSFSKRNDANHGKCAKCDIHENMRMCSTVYSVCINKNLLYIWRCFHVIGFKETQCLCYDELHLENKRKFAALALQNTSSQYICVDLICFFLFLRRTFHYHCAQQMIFLRADYFAKQKKKSGSLHWTRASHNMIWCV